MTLDRQATDIDAELHERLLAGDPLATHDLFERHYRPLVTWLGGKYRTTDADIVSDAVTQTLLDYFDRPERFDPRRRSLFGYLKMAAEGDVRNLRERHRGRIERETPAEDVELATEPGNAPEDGLLDLVIEAESAEALWERIAACAENGDERIVLRLMWDLERTTEAYAQALGLADLAPADQRTQVYQMKDRLLKRVRRRLRNRDV
jgi:RNA polymerase sigma-70 factor (ECF subfamily)